MAYSDKVLDHYENPRNVGSFAKDDDAVGTGGDRVGETGGEEADRVQVDLSDG